MAKKESGKKGGRKIGRGLRKPSHTRYTNNNRWLSNRIRDLKRHIRAHTNDLVAERALRGLTT